MAVALARRGVGPGAHVALLGPTTRPLVTAIQAVWLAGATVVVLPLPMRMNSLDDFVVQTRIRVRAADTTLVVADPMLAGFIQPESGDPPVVLLGDLTGDASDPWAWEAPKDDPPGAGHPAVHQRVDGRPQGRDAAPRHDLRQPRRHRRGGRARPHRRRPLQLAPALPRHGPHRAADAGHDHRHRPRPGLAAGLPGCPGPVDAVDVGPRRQRHRRPQLLLRPGRPGPAPPGPRHPRPVPPAGGPQRRRSGRPQGGGRLRGRRRCRRASTPGRCSRPSAWPRRPWP